MALRLTSMHVMDDEKNEDKRTGLSGVNRLKAMKEEQEDVPQPAANRDEPEAEPTGVARLQALKNGQKQTTVTPAPETPSAAPASPAEPAAQQGRIRPGWDTADAAMASEAQDRREKPFTAAADDLRRLNNAAGVNIDDLREDLTQRAAERDAADSALGQIVEPWNRANATAQNLRSQVAAYETKLGMLQNTMDNSDDPEERRRAQQESQALDLYYQKAQRAAERYESRFNDLNTQFQQLAIARNKANRALETGMEQYDTLLSLGDKRAAHYEQQARDLRDRYNAAYQSGMPNAWELQRQAENAEAKAAAERQNYAEYLAKTKGEGYASRYLQGIEDGNRAKAEKASFGEKVLNTVAGLGENFFSGVGGAPWIFMARLMEIPEDALYAITGNEAFNQDAPGRGPRTSQILQTNDPFRSDAETRKQRAGSLGGMLIDTGYAAGNMLGMTGLAGQVTGALSNTALMSKLSSIAESSTLATSPAARRGAQMAINALRSPGNLGVSLSSGVSSYSEALANGASFSQAMANGISKAVTEYVSNRLFSGMPLENAPGEKGYVTKAIEFLADKLGKSEALAAFNKTTGGKVLGWIYDKAGEGLEEVVTGLLDPIIDRMTYDKEADWLPKLDQLADEFIGGVMLSLLMSGGEAALAPAMTRARIAEDLVRQGVPKAEARKYAGMIYKDRKAAERAQKAVQEAAEAGITEAPEADAAPMEAATNESTPPAQGAVQSAPQTALQQKVDKYAREGKLSGQDARDIMADPRAMQTLIDAGLITGREMNDSEGRRKVADAAEKYIRNVQAEEQNGPPVPGAVMENAAETAGTVQGTEAIPQAAAENRMETAESRTENRTETAESPTGRARLEAAMASEGQNAGEAAAQAPGEANAEAAGEKVTQRTLASERQKTAEKAASLRDAGFSTAGEDATARIRSEESWDAEEKAVGQALRDLGYEPTFAVGLIENAEGKSVPYLLEGNKLAVRSDHRNQSVQEIAEKAVGQALNIDQGVRNQVMETITQARAEAKAARQAAKKPAETPKVTERAQAAMDSARTAGASEENVALVGRLANMLDRDIRCYNDPGVDGANTNGYTKDGVLYINVGADMRTTAWVVGHELTHNTEDSKYYKALKKLAQKELGLNWSMKVQSKIQTAERVAKKLGNDSIKVDRDGAEREVVADFFADRLLSDEASIRRVCEFEPVTARNIRDYIKGLLRKLGGKETTLEKAVKLYNKALKDVEAKAQADAENKLRLPREKAKSAADIRNAKYSIQSIFDAAGFKVTMQGGRVIAKDSEGNRITKMTEDMVRQSGIGAMIRFAQENTKTISKAEADTQVEGLTRLFNLMLKAQDGDMVWRFAGSAMFSAVKSNSDGQYRTTVDFSTVCKKTQEMMETMSKVMVKTHKGLTKAEIIELQNDILEENGLVPCPVCYVFSRWAGVGGILDNMAKYQRKYDGAEWDDPERVKTRIDQLKAATKSKKDLRALLMQEDSSYMQYTGELEANKTEQKQLKDERKKLTGKKANAEENAARVAEIDQRLKELAGLQRMLENDIKGIESSGAPEAAWLERVRMSDRYRQDGYVEEDLLYNLLAADELAERKPLAWGYRTTRGPSAGKAILPYSDMRLGDWILGPGKNSAKGENLMFSSVNEDFTRDQVKAIGAARARVLAQNLIGGQRYQSTSDFMYDYGLDYLLSFFEGQMLGSKMQTYTKVMEFVNLVASVHGDVNISMMPLDAGYVTEADGRKHLIYSSVTGANPEAAIRANHLFDNAQLILVGINDEHILLALEDSEETGGIEIGFVIPYHASGASINNFIRGLVENLKESFNEENYKNYEPMQNDVHRKGATATQEAREHLRHYLLTGKRGKTEVSVSANENGLTEAEMKLLKGKNKDISGMSFEELRAIEKAALQGDKAAIKEYESWSAGILGDIYKKMWVDKKARDTYGVRLATTQAEHIMPHEYWDKSVDRAHAYVNGFIFRSYCYSLGLTPRFTGFDSSGRKLGYGDFSDSTGYWKTLIDRPMYDRQGKYRDQQTMNVTELSSSITGEYVEGQAGSGAGMLSPEYGREFWGENAQTPDTGVAARAAERYLERQYSAEDEENAIQWSVEEDPETLEMLNSQPTVTVYRAMQLVDGKLYPPMAAKVKDESGKAQWVDPTELDTWYRSDERPELIDANGKFVLDKGNGSSLKAAYNPYFHTSNMMLNDQFSSAWDRDNLVVVEASIPQSELTSGYRARGAKDPVGEMNWHSGPVASKLKGDKARRVTLSRWVKINRVVPNAEVAQSIAKLLDGENISVPENTVTPSLRAELEKLGVQISPATGNAAKKKAQFSAEDEEYLAAVESGDMETAQRMVDEAAKKAGYTTPKLYHGTRAFGFTEFDTSKSDDGISLFVTDNPKTAQTYSGETQRNRINEASRVDVDSLSGEQLLEEAKKQPRLKRYQDYHVMSDDTRQKLIDEDRRGLAISENDAKDFLNKHRAGFGEDGAADVSRFIEALSELRKAKTEDQLDAAFDKLNGELWDIKWMSEDNGSDIAYDFMDEIGWRQIQAIKNRLSDFMYSGDIFIDKDEYGYVFDNQIALELDAELHKGVYELYGKPGRQLVINADGANWNQITPPEELNLYGPQKTRDIATAAKANGYDSVLFKGLRDNGGETAYNGESDVYIFFNPESLKSADPVTYDDNGNVIPLSERFNPEKEDIRYSAEDSDDEYRQTPQTPALEKLGVRLAGSKGRYDLSEQLLDRDKAAKELMKATKKAERKLNATKAEKEFAAGIASGIYDEADIPSTMDKDKVTTLADYYTAEESFKLNMLSEVRGMINEEYQDEAEGLLKDVDGFKKLSMLQMNERTPDRTFRAMFGPEQGKQIFDWLIRPVQLNEAEKTRWHQTQLDRVRKFKDSKGKTRELTRDESALTMLVMEGKAAAQAVADLEADAEKGNAIKQAARDLSRGMTQAEAAEKYGLTEKEVILAQRYRQGAQERAQREVANLVAKEDTAQRFKNAAENIRNGEDPGDAAWEFGLKDSERDMAVNYATWMDTQEKLKNADSTIIETAAKEYAKIFDEFYDAINDFLVAHGYEPIGYIKGYAPHMQPEETQNLLEKAFDKMGIDLGNDKAQGLPANIAGETAYFKPNKRWDPYFLHRTGTKAEYDIVKAYQSYVGYLSDILYHTDDIMRVRNMEKMIRKTYAPDDISEVLSQIKFIRSAPVEDRLSFLRDAGKIGRTTQLSTDEINDKLDEWEEEQYQALAEDKQYNNLVMWLSNYANILAGKQSFADRGWEYSLGRNSLNFANRLQAAFQRSLVAGSLTSALNQTAQLPMIKAELGDRWYYAALKDILTGQTRGFWKDSDFLTGKHGVDMLYTDNYDKFISALFKPSTAVDYIVSTTAVRGAFLKAIHQGQSYSEAMRTADDFGRKVMGSREKGTRPLAYESKGLFSRMIHMFQVEAANSWDHIASDLPYEIKEIARTQGKPKAARTLAALLVKSLLSTFLLNRLTEEAYGGTPAPFDVIGLAMNFVASGQGMTTNQYLKTIIDNGLEKIGSDRIFGTEDVDAEFDVGKGLEELGYNVMNDVPLLRNLAGVLGLGDQTVPLPGAGGEFKDALTAAGDLIKDGADGQTIENLIRAAAKLGAQFVPAGRQLTKTGEGIETVIRGGSYSKKGKLQYPVDSTEDQVRAILFGKNATNAAQEHWASGENTLTDKQTELVSTMRGWGLSGAEARQVIRDIGGFEADTDPETGKTISGSKKAKVVDYIDGLKLTSDQKDQLYLAQGYAESGLDETPWHAKGGSSGAGKTYSMGGLRLPTPERRTPISGGLKLQSAPAAKPSSGGLKLR